MVTKRCSDDNAKSQDAFRFGSGVLIAISFAHDLTDSKDCRHPYVAERI